MQGYEGKLASAVDRNLLTVVIGGIYWSRFD